MSNYRPPLKSEVISKIFELRENGDTHREIASKLGISRPTVMCYLNPKAKGRRYRTSRKYRRLNHLTTTINGVSCHLRVKKRSRPETCELCHEAHITLYWHHWNDQHPELGLWLCSRCHRFGEGVDYGLDSGSYLELKHKFTSEKFSVPIEVEGEISQYWS